MQYSHFWPGLSTDFINVWNYLCAANCVYFIIIFLKLWILFDNLAWNYLTYCIWARYLFITFNHVASHIAQENWKVEKIQNKEFSPRSDLMQKNNAQLYSTTFFSFIEYYCRLKNWQIKLKFVLCLFLWTWTKNQLLFRKSLNI